MALSIISGGGAFYDFNLDFGCCFGTVLPRPPIVSAHLNCRTTVPELAISDWFVSLVLWHSFTVSVYILMC